MCSAWHIDPTVRILFNFAENGRSSMGFEIFDFIRKTGNIYGVGQKGWQLFDIAAEHDAVEQFAINEIMRSLLLEPLDFSSIANV